VSSNQWVAVYAYATSHGYGFDYAGSGKAANHPVQTVDWFDCVKWCNARSQKAGLTPVYYTDAGLTQVYTNGDANITNVNANWTANGYRLPTEAEWEKAARGGLSGQRFPWGDTISESQANYDGDSSLFTYDLGPNGDNTEGQIGGYPYTSPVGYFAANGYGLYDMAGNVSEWCWDWIGTPYGQPTTTNPTGPTSGSYRVLRGGDWNGIAYYARCADRGGLYPGDDYVGFGFRCVRGLPNPPAGMAFIPAGSFTIGNSIGDGDITDANPTNVYVSAFYMDTNLVSSNQWAWVYNYAVANGYSFDDAGAGNGTNYPVETVDWYDCVKWSNARSQQAGLTPVYYTDVGLTQVYTNGETTNVFANWMANGYRLPTEAEWDKTARGGLSGHRFPWGDTISESHANYYGDPNPPDSGGYTYDFGPYTGYNPNFDIAGYPYTSPVGYFAANGYGLYDMAGNIDEWCWDWYGTPYGQPTTMNPTGPATGSYRVLRGGFWGGLARLARCASRTDPLSPNDGLPSGAYFFIGFRCVRGL
jgi:formylglycine-generating enzyme required for sulfatase activity